MMAKMWPNCEYENTNFTSQFLNDYLLNYSNIIINSTPIIGKMLPFNKARTKAITRIGPHNKQVLDIIICGMLGDFWADKIPGKQIPGIRFNIEQSIRHTAYIHQLTLLFYKLGYCARPIPTLIKKYDKLNRNRFNYKLNLFTFSNLVWIYDSFYIKTKDNLKKQVPNFISDYLSPIGISNWIMQDGSFQKGRGINLATNNFSYQDCLFLANIFSSKYNLKQR